MYNEMIQHAKQQERENSTDVRPKTDQVKGPS